MRVPKANRLPLLDIAKYHSDQAAFVEELRVACHTVGFFLIRHGSLGSPSSLTTTTTTATSYSYSSGQPQQPLADRMLEETKRFFERPWSEKLQKSYETNRSFRGYMPLGVENTAGVVDYREQVEYATEFPPHNQNDNNDNGNNNNDRPFYERLQSRQILGRRLFNRLSNRVTLEFAHQVCQIADCIRDSLCLALQMDPQLLSDKFQKTDQEVPHWALKLIYYPPAVSSYQIRSLNA
eukprot:scaffold3823_cov195-Amphora_coffeaeformis.AAC.22